MDGEKISIEDVATYVFIEKDKIALHATTSNRYTIECFNTANNKLVIFI